MNDTSSTSFTTFLTAIADNPPAAILELGTRKWGTDSTHHKHLFPTHEHYEMCDFIDGEDVTIVSDAHDLKEFQNDVFDCVFTASTFEHIQYPWVAAQAIHRVLKPGGFLFVQTHQTFPIHGYPFDYTRWSDAGLRSLFEWAGFHVRSADMFDRCTITPRPDYPVWDSNAAAYIGVACFAVKP